MVWSISSGEWWYISSSIFWLKHPCHTQHALWGKKTIQQFWTSFYCYNWIEYQWPEKVSQSLLLHLQKGVLLFFFASCKQQYLEGAVFQIFFINFVAITNQRILHEDYSTQTVWISSSAHNKGMLFWLCFLSSVTYKWYFDSNHFCS